VAEAARGRNTAQLKATARVGERVVITAQASAGQQPDQGYRQLIGAPAVSPPLHCPVVAKHGERSGGVSSQFEYRLIRGRYPTADTAFDGPGDGRLTFWVRPRDQVRTDACLIAIVADFVSDALSDAVGRYVHASSIDNTLRLGPIEDSDWLICDVTIEALHGGVGHGSMRIFSETGRLLALASTSLIVRSPRRGA
jgi:acyl-CoA thioesterase-2